MNFEGTCLGSSLADSAQIWNWTFPTRGNLCKICMFLFWECLGTDAWKRCFLYSRAIRTCLSHTPGFLGWMTHLLLLLLDGQRCPGKIICQASPQAFENAHIQIGTKNHQDTALPWLYCMMQPIKKLINFFL